MTTLLEDAKTYKKEYFLFGEGYEHFYFITNDYYGEALLWMLCNPDATTKRFMRFFCSLSAHPRKDSAIENDAVTEDGMPILFAYQPDLPTSIVSMQPWSYCKGSGIIVCFNFQEDALRPFCGAELNCKQSTSLTLRGGF